MSMPDLPAEFSVDAAGWVANTRHVISPNTDARPEGMAPTLLVVHNISLPPSQFGGQAICDFFCNQLAHDAHPYYDHLRGVCVSAHFLIDRMGQVVQFVSCLERAWHAGPSSFLGRERCNDFSIGIELEGTDDQPFESAQYCALNRLIFSLLKAYPLAHCVGHSDIAPGRKTDPGPFFDWKRVRENLAPHTLFFPFQ